MIKIGERNLHKKDVEKDFRAFYENPKYNEFKIHCEKEIKK